MIKKKINHVSGIIEINREKKEIFKNILILELSVSDEDKHCYACKDADDECVTPCHWTQRCYIKAKHANATSLVFFIINI